METYGSSAYPTAEERVLLGVMTGDPWDCEGDLRELEDLDGDVEGHGSLLHMAVWVGSLPWVRRLLFMGANPSLRDRNGLAPLEVAEYGNLKHPGEVGRQGIVELLRSASSWHAEDSTEAASVSSWMSAATCPGEDGSVQGEVLLEGNPFLDAPAGDETETGPEFRNKRDEKVLEDMLILERWLKGQRAEQSDDHVSLTQTGLCLLVPGMDIKFLSEIADEMGPLKEKEDRYRRKSIHAIMGMTVVSKKSNAKVYRMKRLYRKLYSASLFTAILVKYIPLHPEVKIHVDFESAERAKRVGEGREKVDHVVGVEDEGRQDLKALGRLAHSLCVLANQLAFRNGGRPYFAEGDREKERVYEEILKEAESLRDSAGFGEPITWALDRVTREEREVYLIGTVPELLVIERFTGVVTRNHLPRLYNFYVDQVVFTLNREWKSKTVL